MSRAVRGFDAPVPPGVARSVAGMQVSAIKQMAILAARVPGAASLAWGLPSFRTPEPIRAAVKRALDEDADLGRYTLPDGLPQLRALAAERHAAGTDLPRLDRLAHVFDYARPEGAYYVFPRSVAGHDDSVAFCMRLLEEARVSLTPGAAFGPAGEHHVRMAFCVDEHTIDTAFDRLEALFPA